MATSFEVGAAEVLENASLARENLKIPPAWLDEAGTRVGVVIIDGQICFTMNQLELAVPGGIEDMQRLAAFLENNAWLPTGIEAMLDTHGRIHIFYPWYYVNESGSHPPPFTQITAADLEGGRWKVNPAMAYLILGDMSRYEELVKHTIRYMKALQEAQKPPVCTWNAHAELGTPGHAMVPELYRACTFFQFVRWGHFRMHLKGEPALAESLSPFRSQVLLKNEQGVLIGEDRRELVRKLFAMYDVLLVAGEASSHCVSEGGFDVMEVAESLMRQDSVYFLSDCMSPVPGFEHAGRKFLSSMWDRSARIVKTTDPLSTWGGPIAAALEARGGG